MMIKMQWWPASQAAFDGKRMEIAVDFMYALDDDKYS